jgi:hypothetical protein
MSTLSLSGGTTPSLEKRRTIRFSTGSATLQKLNAVPGYRLSFASDRSGREYSLHIPYPVYRFDIGDVNNDGNPDILLGVVKSTHFDPVVRRRLFLYKTGARGIQPLWLGSRVCLPLVDFRCVRQGTVSRVMTIEQDSNGRYCNGFYKWHDFGLELVHYTNRKTDYDTARHYFESQSSL